MGGQTSPASMPAGVSIDGTMTADEFRAWRKRLGLTQAQAAEAIGRSFDWVQSVECGRRVAARIVELACWAVERQAVQTQERERCSGR